MASLCCVVIQALKCALSLYWPLAHHILLSIRAKGFMWKIHEISTVTSEVVRAVAVRILFWPTTPCTQCQWTPYLLLHCTDSDDGEQQLHSKLRLAGTSLFVAKS